METFSNLIPEVKTIEKQQIKNLESVIKNLHDKCSYNIPESINDYTKQLIIQTSQYSTFYGEYFETQLRSATSQNSLYSFLNYKSPLYLVYYRLKICHQNIFNFLQNDRSNFTDYLNLNNNETPSPTNKITKITKTKNFSNFALAPDQLIESLETLDFEEALKTINTITDSDIDDSGSLTSLDDIDEDDSENDFQDFKLIKDIKTNLAILKNCQDYTENVKEIKNLLKLKLELKVKEKVKEKEEEIYVQTKYEVPDIISKLEGIEGLDEIDTEGEDFNTKIVYNGKNVDIGKIEGMVKVLELKKRIGKKIGMKFNKIKIEVDGKVRKDVESLDADMGLKVIVGVKNRGGRGKK